MDDHVEADGFVESVSRRRLIALIGAGAAGSALALLSADRAEAGHDSTDVLHLGAINNAPDRTHVSANVNDFAWSLDNSNVGDVAGGIYVTCVGNGKPGIEVDVLDGGGVAVQGVAGCCDNFGQGAATGVQGITGTGIGVQAIAGSHEGLALQVSGRAEVVGDFPQPPEDIPALQVHTNHGRGVVGMSQLGVGVFGLSFDGDEPFLPKVGVEGEAANDGVGVRGTSIGAIDDPAGGAGAGVEGRSGSGPGVVGFSDSGPGVSGNSNEGVGVTAQSVSGFALEVVGQARFSTAGASSVPEGENSGFVANPNVTADSHINITLASNPGGSRTVQWVEKDPGVGFTVHLSSAPPPQRPATDFTYLMVETM